MQIQAREIEAQRRAINLQESSAVMLDRARRPGRSRNARQRAEHAWQKLSQAQGQLDRYRQAS
jgi:hypothetical protein